MDWFSGLQKGIQAATEAATNAAQATLGEGVISQLKEASEKAKVLAAQASEQAKVYAGQAAEQAKVRYHDC